MRLALDAAEVDAFRRWLGANGGEVFAPLSPFEAVRVRTKYGTLILHQNKRGHHVGCERLAHLIQEFRRRSMPTLNRKRRKGAVKMAQIYPALVDRDGCGCFYCLEPVPEPDVQAIPSRRPTIEHLVAVSRGGPDHLSNLFLSHSACNERAGTLSAPEKIRLREAAVLKAAGHER